MDFYVKLVQNNNIYFSFLENEYSPNYNDEEPILIEGEITIEDKVIGNLYGYELYNDNMFYTKCDNVSGDCSVIASTVCGKNGKVLKKYLNEDADFEQIFILDQIQINKEYRNKGIGSKILKNLPNMLQYQFEYGSNIFLVASDFEVANIYGIDSDEHKKANEKLINFYKKFGFKLIKDNVMVYNKKN